MRSVFPFYFMEIACKGVPNFSGGVGLLCSSDCGIDGIEFIFWQ
ncbi:MAG: hypothetical protein Q8926_10580 [Bacteroidota bacterium]|nr:hypothetical protein [Bacteroidota bacterium]